MALDPLEHSLLTTLAECHLQGNLSDWEATAGALADLLEERGVVHAPNYRLIVKRPALTVKTLPGGKKVDFVSSWPGGQVFHLGLLVHGGRGGVEVRSHLCAMLIPRSTAFERNRARRRGLSIQERCVVCQDKVVGPRFVVECVGDPPQYCVLPGTGNGDVPGYLGFLPLEKGCLEDHPSLRPYAVAR